MCVCVCVCVYVCIYVCTRGAVPRACSPRQPWAVKRRSVTG